MKRSLAKTVFVSETDDDAVPSSYPSLNICILNSHHISCLATMTADPNLSKVKKFLVEVLTKTILASKSKIPVASVARLTPFLLGRHPKLYKALKRAVLNHRVPHQSQKCNLNQMNIQDIFEKSESCSHLLRKVKQTVTSLQKEAEEVVKDMNSISHNISMALESVIRSLKSCDDDEAVRGK